MIQMVLETRRTLQYTDSIIVLDFGSPDHAMALSLDERPAVDNGRKSV
jgi:uncharacterized protein YcgL (UPF0745 family)